MQHQTDHHDKLLLTVRQAADALSVSERHLFNLTSPRGPLPVRRIGPRGIRYCRADLERFADGELTLEA